MYPFQIICKIVIFSILIKCSLEICHKSQIVKDFCKDFQADGTCLYEKSEIVLMDCIDMTEINSTTFDEIMEEFEVIEDFKYLSLSENGINSISGCGFENLLYLVYLNLSYNDITILPSNVFNNLANLEVLDLSHNKIRFIESNSLGRLSNLRELYLNNNDILEVTSFLGDCKQLKILDLSNNKLEDLLFLKYCEQLVQLQVSYNNINEINMGHESLLKLMFLDVSNNNLTYIDTEIELPNLRLLDLSKNKNLWKSRYNPRYGVQIINVELFENTPQLNTLLLSDTNIENLKLGAFSNFTNLEVLDLSSNNLNILPSGIFYELRSLKKLYLNNNRLSTFKYDSNPLLKEISLHDNSWYCDNLLYLIKSLDNVKIVQRNNELNLNPAFNDNRYGSIYGITCQPVSSVSHPEENVRYLSIIHKDLAQVYSILKEIRDKN